MEEKYKGYTIKYDEERERFEARGEEHNFSHARLKELRRRIDKQVAHDAGFKPFEAWYFDGQRARHVRVTSVNQEPRYLYSDGPDQKPVYWVRITYLDKVEDGYHQRTEVDHTSIFALDPETAKYIEFLNKMAMEQDSLKAQIERLAKGLERLKPSDLGITTGES